MTDRVTDSQVDRLFLDRWSPRASDGSSLGEADLRTLFDAARTGTVFWSAGAGEPGLGAERLAADRDNEKPSGRKPIDEVAFAGNFVA